ncbi:MAG: hypothetical protein ACQETL_19405 [Bacteroidota bacterium]
MALLQAEESAGVLELVNVLNARWFVAFDMKPKVCVYFIEFILSNRLAKHHCLYFSFIIFSPFTQKNHQLPFHVERFNKPRRFLASA